MQESDTILTVGQAMQRLGLDADPFVSAANAGQWWSFEVFGLKVSCYNFAWRRRALAFHDLHHVVTNYPCTMQGEMQVATWEFAAGSYPNLFAKLFCLPLVALGAVYIPSKILAAYQSGRRSKSLFSCDLDSKVTTMPVAALRRLTLGANDPSRLFGDTMGFLTLISASSILYLLPLLVGWLMLLYWPFFP